MKAIHKYRAWYVFIVKNYWYVFTLLKIDDNTTIVETNIFSSDTQLILVWE